MWKILTVRVHTIVKSVINVEDNDDGDDHNDDDDT